MTHTFEIICEQLTLQGEISFRDNMPCQITTDNPINLSLTKYKDVHDFLSCCNVLAKDYGEITKLEIVKK
jgi:hypothetical protein